MSDLCQRMDPCIGSPGTTHVNLDLQDLAGCGNQRVLNRPAVFLALPSMVARSIVFESELEAFKGHGSSKGKLSTVRISGKTDPALVAGSIVSREGAQNAVGLR